MKFTAKFNEYGSPNRGGKRHKQVIPTGANGDELRIQAIAVMQEFYQVYHRNSNWHHNSKLSKQKYDSAWTPAKNLEEAKKNNDKRRPSVKSHHVWEADILRHNVVVEDVVYSNLLRISRSHSVDPEEQELYCEIYDRYYIEVVDYHGAKTNFKDLLAK